MSVRVIGYHATEIRIETRLRKVNMRCHVIRVSAGGLRDIITLAALQCCTGTVTVNALKFFDADDQGDRCS